MIWRTKPIRGAERGSSPGRWAAGSMLVCALTPLCLWDYDTLLMERSRFPDALELVTGKFRRHSPELYEWRVEDRRTKLETEPDNLQWRDDLAVALDKLGRHDEAIGTIRPEEDGSPERYETLANLGTFHVHAGRLEEGLGYIRRAIEVNPDAHFGREIVQALLVEYVLDRRSAGVEGLPLGAPGFYEYLFDEGGAGEGLTVDAAVKGVLGMMRFGSHDSPVLLEALGSLLAGGGYSRTEDAKRLAARAYLKASYEVEDEAQRDAYREVASQALQMQTPNPSSHSQLSLAALEATLATELAEAATWYSQLRADELRWIEEGVDVDAAFAEKYFADPEVDAGDGGSSWWPSPAIPVGFFVLAIAFLVARRRASQPG